MSQCPLLFIIKHIFNAVLPLSFTDFVWIRLLSDNRHLLDNFATRSFISSSFLLSPLYNNSVFICHLSSCTMHSKLFCFWQGQHLKCLLFELLILLNVAKDGNLALRIISFALRMLSKVTQQYIYEYFVRYLKKIDTIFCTTQEDIDNIFAPPRKWHFSL